MEKHPTPNIQPPTPKPSGQGRALDVGRLKLEVGCFPISKSWLFMNSGRGDGAFNMALDEALLDAMPRLQKPVLRLYGWAQSAASFGYFQKYNEVERATFLRPLVRRPTGGGIVPHDADWTYSLTFPTSHEWYALKAIESYRRVHEWIERAFAQLNVATELAPCCKKSFAPLGSRRREEAPSQPEMDQSLPTSLATPVLAGQCFARPEPFDLLWRGKKIAGAAQRRNRLGLLIQGSVQPPPLPLARADWENAMREAAQTEFHVEWTGSQPDAALRERTDSLVAQKYALEGYNRRR